MPLLFALGQHRALVAIQSELQDGEFLSAYLDDIYAVVPPDRVGAVSLQCNNICGGTQVWNREGVRLATCWNVSLWQQTPQHGCGEYQATRIPEAQQGMKVLGTPLGHPSFVEAHLQKKLTEQRTFLERIPEVQDLQSAWSLLVHSASARANYLLRVSYASPR